MRPPICEICNERFDSGSEGLISFAVDAQTEDFDRRAEQPGFVGHRPNRGWFCPNHASAARELVDLTLGDALSALRATSSEPKPEPKPSGDSAEAQVPPTRRRPRRPDADAGLVEAEVAVDIDVFELHKQLLVFRPVLMAALGLPDEVELETRTKRSWTPMDGAREPHCPYSDLLASEAQHNGIEQGVSLDSSWWNPDNLANASARLYIIDRPSPNDWASYVCRLSGATDHLSNGDDPVVRMLRIGHREDAGVAALIADFAAGLSPGGSAS